MTFHLLTVVITNILPMLVICRSDCKVIWKYERVSLGEDSELKCSTTGTKCTGSFKWVGGPRNFVLTFRLRVSDPQKYAVNDNRGYNLIIKNITSVDLNVMYVCHCGFFHYGDILRLKKKDKIQSANTRGHTGNDSMSVQISTEKNYGVNDEVEEAPEMLAVVIVILVITFSTVVAIIRGYYRKKELNLTRNTLDQTIPLDGNLSTA